MTASFRPLANKALELSSATAGGMIDARLAVPGHPERDRRLDWEAMKTRVLSVLKQRAEREGVGGLSNREIRQITHLDRNQVFRLLLELRKEQDGVGQFGKGRGARYVWQGTDGDENGSNRID